MIFFAKYIFRYIPANELNIKNEGLRYLLFTTSIDPYNDLFIEEAKKNGSYDAKHEEYAKNLGKLAEVVVPILNAIPKIDCMQSHDITTISFLRFYPFFF
jgi:hypothetical protein